MLHGRLVSQYTINFGGWPRLKLIFAFCCNTFSRICSGGLSLASSKVECCDKWLVLGLCVKDFLSFYWHLLYTVLLDVSFRFDCIT